jgi:hypothetical protein
MVNRLGVLIIDKRTYKATKYSRKTKCTMLVPTLKLHFKNPKAYFAESGSQRPDALTAITTLILKQQLASIGYKLLPDISSVLDYSYNIYVLLELLRTVTSIVNVSQSNDISITLCFQS